ncbi:MAG: rRNA adenine N-6-methyltransferase family protein, partial [Myxococcota bacterium]|nr:rRNA adenine N-6-methyltransferase family protein [Myxococcota bacterium]
QRMAAESGTKEYGLLSILLQRKFAVEKAFDVPPGSFFPPPRVTSAVVVLDRCPEAWSGEEDVALVKVARASFSQRRKKLRNSLKGGLGISAECCDKLLHEAGIDGSVRAETLALDSFLMLGQTWMKLRPQQKDLPSL